MTENTETPRAFEELATYINFYRNLARTTYSFATMGTRAAGNIDSYIFSSMQNTIGSIQTILKEGKINDAYALLRKYSDSSIINIYTNLYLETEFTPEKVIARKSALVEKIDNWLAGKAKLPRASAMLKYIYASPKAAPVKSEAFPEADYKELRDRCNDHSHYNFYRFVLLNDPEIHVRGREEAVKQFGKDLRDMFIWHLGYLFYTQGHYMMSSDHIDYLDAGLTPEPDSQYWVAPFVQEIFDNVIKRHKPDMAKLIKRDTTMHLN
jgi:hypothetical protein